VILESKVNPPTDIIDLIIPWIFSESRVGGIDNSILLR